MDDELLKKVFGVNNEFYLDVKDWAHLNHERAQINDQDPRVIGFVYDDVYITNPFYDESCIAVVDPKQYYGKHYDDWLVQYIKQKHSH